ncbi:hypothetical protein LTR97_006269 [Elasticomyces elasticus]|uniref:MYND-type domain-containing protein n=1 Tax=Elasticomyces elasticus TaxID=574655 RepID=A0AAN7W7Q3_9PEZI|nr:hypothetical protein LTR97_006269 [Elasticomyces elasticus]
MGASGYGLFESDDDADIVFELDEQAGLPELAKKILAEKAAQNDEGTAKAPKDEHRLSLLSYHNQDESVITAVRDHMNAGKLQEMVDSYVTQFFAANGKDYYTPEYKLCILGACAMTLGCTLTTVFKAQLGALYHDTLKMAEARSQMKRALYGPDGFVDGVQYNLPMGTLTKPTQQAYSGGLLNVQGQFGLFGSPANKPDVVAKMKRMMEAVREDSSGVVSSICVVCGKDEGEGGKMLQKCTACKRRGYCSREHQKAHWKVHKPFCKAVEVVGGEHTG